MMKQLGFVLQSILLSTLVLAGCGKETKTGTDMGQVGNDLAQAPASLQGNWLSSGSDVAPLLAADPFSLTSITANFADATYTVVGTDKTGKKINFSGTWMSSPSSDLQGQGFMDIQLFQAQPAVATSKGIYRIDATVTPQRMTYEVVQIMPDIMVSPPTAAAGFGSTNSGKLGMANVQKFVRTGS